MSDRPHTPVLDRVSTPADMKSLSDAELHQLADDVRSEVISAVSVTGGHLGAGLGVVELTVALHAVFDTPKDKIIWDVGHQCYPHKVLTGRRDRIRTLRQKDGLSGFTKRSESRLIHSVLPIVPLLFLLHLALRSLVIWGAPRPKEMAMRLLSLVTAQCQRAWHLKR